jgi:hypothetical protein
MKRQRGAQFDIICVSMALLVTLALAGCQSTGGEPQTGWSGPSAPEPVKTAPWQYRENPGRTLETRHYAIHTTISDDQFLDKLAQVMEGALAQYRQLAPGLPENDRPMDCYVFASRPEWIAFTKEHTGYDAPVYLRINRGGYTRGDWFVAYYIEPSSTFSVAAHEGWHQYVARNFKNHLPPFLEEGVATQFESIRWEGGLPRWNVHYNANRAQRLRQTIDGKDMWPLEQLVTMHAGDVVGSSGEKIEAFYAQDWAFVRFAWDAENGKYRPAFQHLLADAAAGTMYNPLKGAMPQQLAAWNPRLVKPILEHYFGMDFADLDKAYQAYLRVLAYEKFNEQWQAN